MVALSDKGWPPSSFKPQVTCLACGILALVAYSRAACTEVDKRVKVRSFPKAPVVADVLSV